MSLETYRFSGISGENEGFVQGSGEDDSTYTQEADRLSGELTGQETLIPTSSSSEGEEARPTKAPKAPERRRDGANINVPVG
ncbi:uncharacterized protein K460DRAFT_368682 [Cucurbitaria berberidis CBS 394.84]|uniref:Uncharacterized protein n=1 Tax=Cucurbitaria berberidis CBS 394.84 TaxID=1168544 RepID=A0A9P4GDZ6_9PLEO|nr:uncharacterized protein K460DRAFT_368682 [Cucurbitaria berberidis CBS 394.84]KAF1843825.1 hypothetical protein K460DRAFT_368682 [Cucurbitaria berberidis CBS 394.84]